jgi:hypothetical protein
MVRCSCGADSADSALRAKLYLDSRMIFTISRSEIVKIMRLSKEYEVV